MTPLLLALGLLLGSPPAAARDAVVVLRSDDLPAYDATLDAFQQAVGAPVQVLDLRGDAGTAKRTAKALTADPPPAVLALGAKAAWTAREIPQTVPVVYALVRDPSRYGLERINMTGVGMNIPPAIKN